MLLRSSLCSPDWRLPVIRVSESWGTDRCCYCCCCCCGCCSGVVVFVVVAVVFFNVARVDVVVVVVIVVVFLLAEFIVAVSFSIFHTPLRRARRWHCFSLQLLSFVVSLLSSSFSSSSFFFSSVISSPHISSSQ